MKKYLIILTCIITACESLKNPGQVTSAQQTGRFMPLEKFKGDTLNYVQKNFVDNKQKYIGKEMNALLKDLEIPVKSYTYAPSFNQPNTVPSTNLYFYSRDQVSKKLDRPDKPFNVTIRWAKPLPLDTLINISRRSKGEWNETERKYYGKQVIGDISTSSYK